MAYPTLPNDVALRVAVPDVPASHAENFRPNINTAKNSLSARDAEIMAALEQLGRQFAPGYITSPDVVIVGGTLSVSIPAGSAVIDKWVDWPTRTLVLPQNVAALGVYIWLRSDHDFSYTLSATPPNGTPASEGSGGDGRGASLLWARATTSANPGGVVTAVDNSVRVKFRTEFLENYMILVGTITEDRLAFEVVTDEEAAATYQPLQRPFRLMTTGAPLLFTDDLIHANGTFNAELPDPAIDPSNIGEWWTLKNIGTGIVTLLPASPALIEGMASVALYPGQSVGVETDGTSYFLF